MADRRLGILLGRTGAEATYLVRRRRGRHKVLARAAVAAPHPLWEHGRAGLRPLFRALARKLPAEARSADVRQFLAIPDPLVTEDRLGFRDLPGNPDEARDLILWRIARDLRKPTDSLACAWQAEKVEDGETRVLVRIIDRALLDAVTDTAGAAGFFFSRIDGWSGYLMNRPEIARAPSGARLWAGEEWWALLCWARAGGGSDSETLVHAEWRVAEAPPAQMADKAARLAKSFGMSSGAGALAVGIDAPRTLETALRDRLADRAEPPSGTPGGQPADGADLVALDQW